MSIRSVSFGLLRVGIGGFFLFFGRFRRFFWFLRHFFRSFWRFFDFFWFGRILFEIFIHLFGGLHTFARVGELFAQFFSFGAFGRITRIFEAAQLGLGTIDFSLGHAFRAFGGLVERVGTGLLHFVHVARRKANVFRRGSALHFFQFFTKGVGRFIEFVVVDHLLQIGIGHVGIVHGLLGTLGHELRIIVRYSVARLLGIIQGLDVFAGGLLIVHRRADVGFLVLRLHADFGLPPRSTGFPERVLFVDGQFKAIAELHGAGGFLRFYFDAHLIEHLFGGAGGLVASAHIAVAFAPTMFFVVCARTAREVEIVLAHTAVHFIADLLMNRFALACQGAVGVFEAGVFLIQKLLPLTRRSIGLDVLHLTIVPRFFGIPFLLKVIPLLSIAGKVFLLRIQRHGKNTAQQKPQHLFHSNTLFLHHPKTRPVIPVV